MSKHPFRMAIPDRAARIARRQRIHDGLQLVGGVLAMASVLAAIVLVHFI